MKKLKLSFLILFLSLSSFLAQAQSQMNDFIGTNMQAKGNSHYYLKFGFLREYHSWGADIGLQRPPGYLLFDNWGNLQYWDENFTSNEQITIQSYLADGRIEFNTSVGLKQAWAYYNLVPPAIGVLTDNHDGTLTYSDGSQQQPVTISNLTYGNSDKSFSFSFNGQTIKLNIRYELVTQMRCPTNAYQLNPSYDQSTYLNYDDFYTVTKDNGVKISPSLMDLAPEMRGITQYLGATEQVHTQKPICVPNPPPYGYGSSYHDGLDINWSDWFYDSKKPFPKIGELSSQKVVEIHFTPATKKLFIAIDWNGDQNFGNTEITAFPIPSGTQQMSLTMGSDISIPTGASSGLYTLRVVSLKNQNGAFPGNSWFDGAMVDLPVSICNTGQYSIKPPIAPYTNMANLLNAHITEIKIDGQTIFDNPVTGYTSLMNSSGQLSLEDNTAYKFIIETDQQGMIGWEISLNGSSLFSETAGNKWTGGFTTQTIPSGLNDLTIKAGQSNETHFLFVKEGNGCTSNTIPQNTGANLTRFLLNKVKDPQNPGKYAVIDQQDPHTYKDYALWNTLIAAKYGTNTSSTIYEPFKELEKNNTQTQIHQALEFMEVGNEEDAYWWEKPEDENTPNAQIQMLPEQYGAMLSAAYDGGCSTMTYTDANGTDHKLGIKNVSSGTDVIPAGLTGLRGQYVIDMIHYFEKTRASCGTIFPFDALNFHHYTTKPASTTQNDVDYTQTLDGMFNEYNFRPSFGNGVSPEKSRLRWMVEETLNRILNNVSTTARTKIKNKEVWFTEFGYDSQSANISNSWSAVPDVGDNSPQETQAQWIVRSYLELAAVEAQGMRVDRATVFDLEDRFTGGLSLFDNCGLIKDKNHNNAPKKSWFHVQTMRNVLGEMTFQKEVLLPASSGLTIKPNGMVPIEEGECLAKPAKDLQETGFDLTSQARIQRYKGTYHGKIRDILAIWSPNSTDQLGELLVDFSKLQGLNQGNLVVNDLTIITPRDGDEDGFHKHFTVNDNKFTFCSLNSIPVSETPMYVVLNVSEDEAKHQHCPEMTVEDKGCTSFTLRWEPMADEPDKVDIYVVNANDAVIDNNGKVVLRVESDAYKLQARDYKYDIRKHGIGHLQPDQSYYVVFLMKWADGSIKVCNSNEIRLSSEDGLCQIPYWDGTGTAPQELYFTAKVGSPLEDGLDAFDNGITCDNVYEYNSGNPLTDKSKIWDFAYGSSQIIVEFSEPIILNSLSFLHTNGNGYLTVEYEICGCPASVEFGTPTPGQGWYHAATFAPNGYMNWTYWSEGFPANYAISRIRLTKNQSSSDNLSLARLRFCGQPEACATQQVPPGPADPSKGFRKVDITTTSGGTVGRIKFDAINNLDNDPSAGYKREYHILYQEENEAELDFTSSTYQKAVLYDGRDQVNVTLKDLAPDTKYKVYLYASDPCNWKYGGRYPIIPNLDNPVIPLVGVKDTIIYFNTFDKAPDDGKPGGGSQSGSDTTHIVTANPNPTTGWTTFNWDLTGYSQLFILSGYTGEVVAKYDVDPTQVSHQVDLTNYSNGPYYIRLEGDQLTPLNGQFIKTTE